MINICCSVQYAAIKVNILLVDDSSVSVRGIPVHNPSSIGTDEEKLMEEKTSGGMGPEDLAGYGKRMVV